VRSNAFRKITAPSGQPLKPAVLVWQGSQDSTVEGNAFINCQREIGFGVEDRSPNDHEGGIIRNNFVYRDSAIEGRAAIRLAHSPNTQVLHNTILANGTYASLIEYRFADTEGVVILNNLLDGEIAALDDASGTSADNFTKATAAMFVNPAIGDLHLVPNASDVIDRVSVLTDAAHDVDGHARPQAAAADYGADEYVGASTEPSPSPPVTSTSTGTATPTATRSAAVNETSAQSSGGSGSSASTANGLPDPWQSVDVGNPGREGTAAWASETFK
jgi:hypothetical protein